MKKTTLCFLVKAKAGGLPEEVMLARKKKGLGEGNWNGVGGKVEPGETCEEAAARETWEETGAIIEEKDLEKAAVISFKHPKERNGWDQECHIYLTRRWKGTPAESQEMMEPRWFPVSALPFKDMWPDDPHWLPLVLAGKKLRAAFHFSKDGKGFDSFQIDEVKDLSTENK